MEAFELNLLAVSKNHFNEYQLSAYRNELIAVNNYDQEKIIPMYGEDADYFYFPRYFFKDKAQRFDRIHDMTTKGSQLDFCSNIQLWDYQEQAIKEFKQHFSEGRTGFFLGAAPGSGKTQMGIEMMQILARTALIVVPKKDLIHQWIERILKTTNIKRQDIGIAQNGKINWEGKKVVIGLVHSLVKGKELQPLREHFGLVLFDECDSSVPPETFAPAASMFLAKYRISMTASKTRADGLHVVFQNHLVEVEIRCSKSNTLRPNILLANYKHSSGELPPSRDRIRRKGMLLSLLAENTHRNDYIAEFTKRAAIGEGRPTVVMSDRVAQLKSIRSLLVGKYGVSPSLIGFYIGDNNKDANKRVADNCQIILATYGMMSRGTDIPRLSCLILASPRNDMRQTVGRIERAYPDKKIPLVVDVVDTEYSLTMQGREKRLNYYLHRNLEVYETR